MADSMMSGGVNKMVAMIAGVVLLLVGVLGFVMDPILGIFEVSILHNLVHVLSGGVLLAGAFMNNGANARMSLLVLGAVYALVTVLGFVAGGLTNTLLMIAGGKAPGTNGADNILHLLLTVVFLAVPLIVKEEGARPVGGRST